MSQAAPPPKKAVPKVVKKPSKPAPKKSTASKSNGTSSDATSTKSAPKAVSKTGAARAENYQKLTLHEQILVRPDTYIGSIERVRERLFVFNDALKKMEEREIEYVPGLFKIFDEILVNAADNFQRDPTMTTLKVDIDQAKNRISIYNDGAGTRCL